MRRSVDGLIDDFINKSSSRYKAAYVYFTDFCPDSLFNKIKASCAKSIKKCKEINISFFPYESQMKTNALILKVLLFALDLFDEVTKADFGVFTLNIPDAFYRCYSPTLEKTKDKDAVLQVMAEQIVTLCATLDENPGVRYKSGPSDRASKLAQLVEKSLENYYKTDERSQIKAKTHSQLIIIDRGFDPVSTVLHELTFQAMAYDLLPIENDTYKQLRLGLCFLMTHYSKRDLMASLFSQEMRNVYLQLEALSEDFNRKCGLYEYKTDGSGGKEKEAILEEDDDLWVKMRHKHIADVLEEIPKLLKDASSKTKAAEGKLSISALSQLMKKMPLYRKEISKQVLHLNIAEDCMSKFKSNVERLCKTEQDLALGTDAEGEKVKDSMRVLLPVLLNKSHDSYDKIRAILLYIFSTNGTTQENLDKLIQNVHIESDSDMIKNWKYLDVPVISSDAIENKLDSKDWPYCSRCPPTWNGSGAVSARQKPRASCREERRSGARLIVFVIGGVTYSEMRSAYEVTEAYKSCEVVIGSTHILTPRKLLEEVKSLSKPKDMVCIKDE
ncbi:Syntaxin-binding protein 3 [Lonchura striata]|uniref:Syntaxin-binding protein 3 n=1 Tax=Lonchura striata TaxID=40157 RepID=A0A218UW15_9PASE|nr:Syntaxin-binding protein 3 [Lonchura striata domestica]